MLSGRRIIVIPVLILSVEKNDGDKNVVSVWLDRWLIDDCTTCAAAPARVKTSSFNE